MVLNQSEYNEIYFKKTVIDNIEQNHVAGYTNYIRQHTDWIEKRTIQRFLKRHNIPKTAKILELGAAVGFMGKIATEEGYTNWTCVDWSAWCKANEVYPIIEQPALTFLKAQADNSFDYIISRSFLECFANNDISKLVAHFARVTLKQIHTTNLNARSDYYTIKTQTNWESKIKAGQNIIIEDYFLDG